VFRWNHDGYRCARYLQDLIDTGHFSIEKVPKINLSVPTKKSRKSAQSIRKIAPFLRGLANEIGNFVRSFRKFFLTAKISEF